MLFLFLRIMSAEMSSLVVAALTMGLRVEKETVRKSTAVVQVLWEFAVKVKISDTNHLLDIVETGVELKMDCRDFEKALSRSIEEKK